MLIEYNKSNLIVFNNCQVEYLLPISIIDQNHQGYNRTFEVAISNVTGNAKIGGKDKAIVEIRDSNSK